MASGTVNKVILIGNLGADPELRTTHSGTPVANLRIATSRMRKDQGGNRQEETEWHNVVLFGRTAEIAQQYLRKGSKVYFEGRLQTRSWDDAQTGQKKFMTEVVAYEMQFLDTKGQGQGQGASGYGGPPQQGGGYGGAPQGQGGWGGGAPQGGGYGGPPQQGGGYGGPPPGAPPQPQGGPPQGGSAPAPAPQTPAQGGGGQDPGFYDDDDIPF